MSLRARPALVCGALAIVHGCASRPAPAAHAAVTAAAASSVTTPIPAPSSSSQPVADHSSEDNRPIAVIANILTRSVHNGWDPSRLWLVSFDEVDGSVDLVCGMQDADDVAEFLRRLSDSPTFTEVTLLSASSGDASEPRAEIRAKVAPNGSMHITAATKSEIDFGKGNRDPFDVPATAPTLSAESEIAGGSALDRLKLVATMMSGSPRAMFVDAAEKSWIAKVGDRIGHADSNAACSWRVADVSSHAVIAERVNAACTDKPAQRVFRLATKKP